MKKITKKGIDHTHTHTTGYYRKFNNIDFFLDQSFRVKIYKTKYRRKYIYIYLIHRWVEKETKSLSSRSMEYFSF